jgi:hypothetical protein
MLLRVGWRIAPLAAVAAAAAPASQLQCDFAAMSPALLERVLRRLLFFNAAVNGAAQWHAGVDRYLALQSPAPSDGPSADPLKATREAPNDPFASSVALASAERAEALAKEVARGGAFDAPAAAALLGPRRRGDGGAAARAAGRGRAVGRLPDGADERDALPPRPRRRRLGRRRRRRAADGDGGLADLGGHGHLTVLFCSAGKYAPAGCDRIRPGPSRSCAGGGATLPAVRREAPRHRHIRVTRGKSGDAPGPPLA